MSSTPAASLFPALRDEVFPALLAAHPHEPRDHGLRCLLQAVCNRMAQARGFMVDGSRPPDALSQTAWTLIAERPGWSEASAHLPGLLYAALGGERHANGRYFTPEALAERVARWVLGGYTVQTVLDPAMGSGHFLIAAAEVIAGPGADASRRWDALGRLYGADCDPAAVDLARVSLWLWAALPGASPDDLSKHLRVGDSLRGDLWPDRAGGFDAVIGNPPYASVFTRSRSEDNPDLGSYYESAAGSYDLAAPFVERSVTLLREGGRCGLVLPNKLLAAGYARPLRRWLGRQVVVERLADLSAESSFDADVYPVVCILRKEVPDRAAPLLVYRGDPPELTHTGSQADLHGAPGDVWSAALDPDCASLRACWEGEGIPLGDIAALSAGLTVAEAYDLRDSVIEAPPNLLPGGFYQFMTTGLIQPYRGLWGRSRATYLRRTFRRPVIAGHALPVRRQAQASQPKILVAGMGLQPRALVDRGLMQASVSTVIITDSRWPLDTLCALLNSRLVARLYRALFGGLALSGGYLRFGKRELSLLPVPDVPGDDPRVQQLAVLGERAAAGIVCDREIDALVCALYGVGEQTPE